MLRTQDSILIIREIRDVYQFVVVEFFHNYPKWSPQVSELEQITAGHMRIGVTGRQVRYDSGHRSESLFRVTHLRPLREVRFVSLSTPKFQVGYLIEPMASQSRLTFNFKLELPLFMRPLRGRIGDHIARGSRQVVRNLKTLLEINAVTDSSERRDIASQRRKPPVHGSTSD